MGYLTSSSTGGFLLAGAFDPCPDLSAQVYVLALGGSPSLAAGTNNKALALVSSAGSCGSLASAPFITVNEATTVAFAAAFQVFTADAFHVGSPANLVGALEDAATASSNLVSVANGAVNTAVAQAIIPSASVNTLADVLVPCTTSAGLTSSACQSLFGLTGGTDSFAAALAIAANPASKVAALFGLLPVSPPYLPVLAQAPADWTLAPQIAAGTGTVAGLTALGDSISTVAPGNGATPVSLGYTQLLANWLGGPFVNNSQGGDEAIDAASKAFYRALPSDAGNFPDTLLIGTNDILFEDPAATNVTRQQIFRDTTMATISLWLTAPANKLIPTRDSTCSGASWIPDGSLPGAANGLGVFTTTVGAPFSCTYRSYGAPIYVWHLIDGGSGTGSVLIDGVSCGSFTTTYAGYTGSHNGFYNTVGALRCPVPAGSHTVSVTLAAGSHIGFEGLGTPPPVPLSNAPPRMYTFGPLHHSNDDAALATDLYAALLRNLSARMAADGYLVQSVNVRDHVLFTGTDDPDSLGGPGSSCMANPVHPANCGHASIFRTLQTTIPKAQ